MEIVYFFGFLVIYFLPVIIAVRRKHRAPWAIGVVNTLFGLTAIGWLIALIWSLNSNVREEKAA